MKKIVFVVIIVSVCVRIGGDLQEKMFGGGVSCPRVTKANSGPK